MIPHEAVPGLLFAVEEDNLIADASRAEPWTIRECRVAGQFMRGMQGRFVLPSVRSSKIGIVSDTRTRVLVRERDIAKEAISKYCALPSLGIPFSSCPL